MKKVMIPTENPLDRSVHQHYKEVYRSFPPLAMSRYSTRPARTLDNFPLLSRRSPVRYGTVGCAAQENSQVWEKLPAIFHRGGGWKRRRKRTRRGGDQVSSSPLVNSFRDLSRSARWVMTNFRSKIQILDFPLDEDTASHRFSMVFVLRWERNLTIMMCMLINHWRNIRFIFLI